MGTRVKPICRDLHQEDCEVGFMHRKAKDGCSKVIIIDSEASVPQCDTDEMNYYYSGHGRGLNIFFNSVSEIIRLSTSNCRNLLIEDGGCSTFDINSPNSISSLYDGRDLVKSSLAHLVKLGQTITIRASQMSNLTLSDPLSNHNPYYAITFNSTGIIKESVSLCKEAEKWSCLDLTANERYLCRDGSGIKRNTCCCKGEKCQWLLNVLACPK